MKAPLLLLTIGILLCNNALGRELSNKGRPYPPTRIGLSVKDSSLSQNEALFELSFTASGVALDRKQEINFSCNGVIQTTRPNQNGNILVKVVPGKYIFNFFYNQNFYEVSTDSFPIQPGYRTPIKVHFRSSTVTIYSRKPVIYLYPEERTKVNIQLRLKGKLEFTYPKYNNGWAVTANPDGTIEHGDQKHHYLFWDGTAELNPDAMNLQEGFVVNQGNLITFFEEKLSKMGLNSHEIEDYITYWGPLMSKYKNTYVHFLFTKEYDAVATVDINPKPDNLFRVFMLWSEYAEDDKALLTEQTIPSFTRNGFSVVEWGGAHVDGIHRSVSEMAKSGIH